jgi:RHS repeat-associated protein
MKKQLRLKSIATGIRTYTLNYTNLYFPLLTSVQCLATHGSLSQSLAPLAFEYNTDSSNGSLIVKSGNLQKYVNYWLYTDIDALTGQFSSSGTEEGVAIYPVRGVYAWKTLNGITSLHSNYNANDSILISPTYTMAVSSQPYVLKANDGFRGIVSLNTDDKPANNEIVLINAVGGTTATQKVSFRIFAETGNNYAVTSTVDYSLPATYKSGNYYSVTPVYYHTGDFIGDGKERVLGVQVFSDYCADNALYLFDLRTKTYASYQPSFTIKETDKIVALDYDGDGKTDLWHFHNNGFNVYSFDPVNPASSLSFSLQKIASSTNVNSRTFDAERNNNGLELIAKDHPELVPTRKNTQKKKVLFGDINGDGKMDLTATPYFPDALHKTSTPAGGWVQLLSAGDGTFKTTYYDLPGIWLNTHGDVFMHDFNGDGYSDLVCMDEKTLQILHSNGLRLDKSKLNSYVVEEATTSGPSESKLFTIGVNSSNHNRIIGYIKGQKIMKLSVNRNETVNTFLTSVKTSHNVKTAIAYKRIDEPGASNPYTAGSGAAFPYENYKGYSWVVSDMNQTFAGKTTLSVNYSYNNAVIHKQGLGFCGFEKIITWNKTANRRDTITYDPFQFGIVKTIAGYDQKTENAYSVTLTGNKEPRIRITGQKTTDLINGNVITTDNLYDTYGNLTRSIKKYGTDYTEQTDISYYHLLDTTRASSDTRIGFPTTKKVKRTRGSNVDSTATEITYSPNYTLPFRVVEKVNNKIVSQITRQFDPFSNITQEETIPYEATSDKRVQTYVYSSNGMLLDKSTDAFGHTTSYAYANNLPTTVTDYRNRPLKYEYDALGRVSKQTNPDNTVEQVSYAYDTSDYYFVTRTVTGQPTVRQRYNGLHQCVREDRQTFNSTVYTSTEYDDLGRVKRISLPAYSTTPSYWNTYAYDAYDRITSLTYASGKKDSYSYGKNTVTSVIDGVSTTKTFDASGQVTKVTDAAGTITYNLRADGQPASIVAPGNITTSFGYDSYGRQTSIADPSAGTQSFAYDASGNLQKTTNAKGQSVTTTYDKYRRIQTKTCPEFTTSYIYNEDNQLNKETSNNGTEKEYTYDSYGRLQTEYEKATYWLKKTYGYANGRVSSVYYESGLGLNVTENYSYSNGYLTEIKAGTTSIWKLTAENAFGQPTGATTGSFNRTYTYNVYGQPTGRKAGSFQNFTYNFTASTGNLNLRKDEKYNMQETFGYDNLDRLTSYGGYSASYDAKGNITRKSDVGDFAYATPNKPYAISAINATAASVASFDQSITYTSFDRPVTITENTYKAVFTYDATGSRKTMAMTKNNAAEYTRYYLSDDYEYDHKTGATKEKLYLGGNCYTAPAVYVRENGGTGKIYYICRDYLGSITHITDNNGTVVQELSYDAWGRLRNPSTQTVYAPGSEPELFLGRGYTGHEHLAKFGLVNMNARLYDPVTSRFVSPDPYIPNPFFSQHLNRYSYCSNNPLKYTDPSGTSIVIADRRSDNEDEENNSNIVGWSTNDPALIAMVCDQINSGVIDISTFSGGAGWNPITEYTNSTGDKYYVNRTTGVIYESSVTGGGRIAYLNNKEAIIPEITVSARKIETATDRIAFLNGLSRLLTTADIYNSLFYNHKTYITTKGNVANIINAKGKVNSARALNFYRLSNTLKGIGVASSIIMTYQGVSNISTGNAAGWDYVDVGAGVVGVGTGAASFWGIIIPGVGQSVAVYGWFRLFFELGAEYGPSTWYGDDDNKWFK